MQWFLGAELRSLQYSISMEWSNGERLFYRCSSSKWSLHRWVWMVILTSNLFISKSEVFKKSFGKPKNDTPFVFSGQFEQLISMHSLLNNCVGVSLGHLTCVTLQKIPETPEELFHYSALKFKLLWILGDLKSIFSDFLSTNISLNTLFVSPLRYELRKTLSYYHIKFKCNACLTDCQIYADWNEWTRKVRSQFMPLRTGCQMVQQQCWSLSWPEGLVTMVI